MELSIWTYPWDVADLGVDAFAKIARDTLGVNRVSLAASYHAGHFLQPASPRRSSYFPEDGTIYFTPESDRWSGRIVPLQAEIAIPPGDVLEQLAARREETGLEVGCWTVCLHNTRLGMEYPDAVTRSAFGDPNYFSLCPSNPEVRAYATTLVADMTARLTPQIVELETPGFMGFDHGYHHEKDGMGLTAEDEFLLSLCFCEHCMAGARDAGVDAEAARDTVRSLLDAAFARAVPEAQFSDFPAAGPDAFAAHTALKAFIDWRSTPVTSLVSEIKKAAHPDSQVIAITGPESWREGFDDAAVAAACDGLLLSLYDQTVETIPPMVEAMRALIGPDKRLVGALRVFYPETPSAAVLTQRAQAAKAGGCDGLNFYNFGLIPAPRHEWIGQACRAVAD